MAILEREILQRQPAAGSSTEPFAPKRWQFTCEQYQAMGEAGVFKRDVRTELIDGEVYVKMSPMGVPHQYVVDKLGKLLVEMLGSKFAIRVQGSFKLSAKSQPQPDVAVFKGAVEDYASRLPEPVDVALLIEVAESSLTYDRTERMSLYASGNIAEYWIVNIRERELIVHRDPRPLDGAYGHVETLPESASVYPSVAPKAVLAILDILPPVQAK